MWVRPVYRVNFGTVRAVEFFPVLFSALVIIIINMEKKGRGQNEKSAGFGVNGSFSKGKRVKNFVAGLA